MKDWRQPALALGLLFLVSPAVPASAQVRLAITNGHVTLSASNATVRQILAEWARVGHTTIVNGDRVPGGPMTLELSNVSEADALEVILRSVSGYVLAPRRGADQSASRFDRILILPTSSPVRAAVPGAPVAFPQPQIAAAAPRPDDDAGDAPIQQAPPQIPQNVPRPGGLQPTFSPFTQPRVTNDAPDAPASPAPSSAAPVGVPRPGMFLPPPPDAQSQPPGGAAGQSTPR